LWHFSDIRSERSNVRRREVKADEGSALIFCFDAFSLREPVSTPDQVRGRLSLENALSDFGK
jgi:hypothetical protein